MDQDGYVCRPRSGRRVSRVDSHAGRVCGEATAAGKSWQPAKNQSIANLMQIDELTPETSGRFLSADGKDVPW